MIYIIIAIIVLILLWVAGVYNSFITSRQRVRNAWSQIKIQLQQRFDMIPNLVESVKKYAKHESEVFEKVTALRSSWANAKTIAEEAEISNQIESSLKTIMAVSENYPELKANENFIQFNNKYSETEDKVSASRMFYNDAVTIYNTKIAVFPANIVASIFKFTPETLFDVDDPEANKGIKVNFD